MGWKVGGWMGGRWMEGWMGVRGWVDGLIYGRVNGWIEVHV